MRIPWTLLSSFALASSPAYNQNTDSATIKVNQVEMELLLNTYFQDGDNSAVTGGIGTEKLRVYGISYGVKKRSHANSFNFKLGVDVISSASTDNIDLIKSSASAKDARTYTSLGYTRYLGNAAWQLGTGVSMSIESDYTSIGPYVSLSQRSADGLREFSAAFQLFFDDLRWGRLSARSSEKLKLVYPWELRYQDWYRYEHRNSYNLNLSYSGALSPRHRLGLFLALAYQEGLLATPFHRVYFTDGEAAVEQLPEERFRASAALRWHFFAGGRLVFKNALNLYADTFGVVGGALSSDLAIKLDNRWSLLPGFRFYHQQAARYFAPFGEHSAADDYYTSDYDLSSFQTYRAALGLTYRPYHRQPKAFNSLQMRYLYYHRSNQLAAHALSLTFNWKYRPKRKLNKK